MKILALVFISAIGVLLVLDSCGITTGIELLDMHLEKLMVYFAMVFAILLELVQMKYNSNLRSYLAEKAKRTKSSAASIKADDASDTFAIDKQNAECVTGDKAEGTER
jgi:predicted tellurium resistance membrane protein TerC